MSKVAMIAKMTAQDGKRDELVAALQKLVAQVQNEEGTEVYVMHTSEMDPNLVVFYELYTDQAALAAHGNSPVMQEAGAALGALLGGRPEITMLTPQAGKGVNL